MGAFIFYLHYTLLTSGLSGTSVLLGVIIKHYSDASATEIGILLMSFPFVSIVIKPLFCSIADQYQAHKQALILSLLTLLIGYTPFIVIPFFPEFYENYPRLSWYLLALSCHVGNAGLGVGWSLGDTLAVNISQKTGTPYSRMRLMGTVSWGIYGYLIGEINETPYLPKFVPGFAILHISVIVEILVLLFWNNEDFEMYDPTEDLILNKSHHGLQTCKDIAQSTGDISEHEKQLVFDSTPSSLGGTLKCHHKAAETLRNFVLAEELNSKLAHHSDQQDELATISSMMNVKKSTRSDGGETGNEATGEKSKDKNTQILMLRMLLKEDGRLIKYLILYTIFGFFMAPINFVFLSLPDICKERDCNFSHLAGTLLIAQATIETISFLVIPWFLTRINRTRALAFCFFIIAARFFYYSFHYSIPSIPPYWAIVGEAGHGISYGIFCTIMAETALMFANQSKLFIPELRRMGLLSEKRKGNELQVEMEENKIKMALRATMQSLFSGVLDGLGNGSGSLLCGLFLGVFSYIHLWQLFALLSFTTLICQQVIEFSRCRWSDHYNAKPGTKAYEILALEKEAKELQLKVKLKSKEATTIVGV